jgi:hypothetical protein
MADTPRGPRPTITRGVAWTLVVGWLAVAGLCLAATLLERSSLEPGWERERVRITKLPYGDCDDGTCTIYPTVELPDGSVERVRLTVSHPDELLPSNHFAEQGTILLWLQDGRQPTSLRPIEASARNTSQWLVRVAGFVAAMLVALAIRASRRHHARRAGHVFDHVAVFAMPLAVLVLAITVAVLHSHWRTPVHEPTKPAPGAASAATTPR